MYEETAPRFAVFSPVDDWFHGYSIVSIMRTQLIGFQELGANPIHINWDKGSSPPEFTGERRFIPRLKLEDWAKHDIRGPLTDWYDNARLVVEPLREALKDVDTLLANDIMMQGWFLPYLWALRQVIKERPDLRVFHSIHSGPSARKEVGPPRNELFYLTRNEYLVYNNASDDERLTLHYGTKRILPIRNPVCLEDWFQMSPDLQKLFRGMSLAEADVITCYPCRLSPGKQVDKWVGVIAGFKEIGVQVRGIIVDSYSTGNFEKEQREKIHGMAKGLGLERDKDYCFTSEFLPGRSMGLERNEVSSLSRLCNVFIQTSVSETCSLIMLEAQASRQLLVLNEDLDCNGSGELMGGWAIPAKFSSLTTSTKYHPSYRAYCVDLARRVMEELQKSPTHLGYLKALQLHNRQEYCRLLLETMGYVEPKVVGGGVLSLPTTYQKLPGPCENKTGNPNRFRVPSFGVRNAIEPREAPTSDSCVERDGIPAGPSPIPLDHGMEPGGGMVEAIPGIDF